MKYSDFFPSYPSLDNYKTIYQQLYEKKEFYDLKGIGELNNFRHYQLIPARFLSPWTFYQKLLLLHDTGTGKSASISAVLDLLKKHDKDLTFIYLVSNDTLVKNFKGYKNTNGRWQEGMIQKHCQWVKNRLKTESWTNVNSFFRRYNMFFATFGSFQRDLEKISKSQLHRVFLVLDEAHHLITKNVNDKKSNYSVIMNFIKNIRELKLLVSTATPMRDDALEILYLLNLVVPLEFPTGKKFFDQYLRVLENQQGIHQNLNIFQFKAGKDVTFRKNLAGYVSVVRQKIENVYPQYIGNLEGDMKSTLIYVDIMESYQRTTYLETWNKKDTTDLKEENEEEPKENMEKLDSLYNNSIQASLMVFPSLDANRMDDFKPYGRLGARKYISNSNLDKNSFNKLFFEKTGLVENPTKDEMKKNLEIIKEYSIVYHNIIRNILNAKKSGKCVYVYSEKINGSGILRCIYLLKQCFNFDIVDSRKSIVRTTNIEKKDRLVFLAEEDIQDLVEMFNNPNNKHGEYFRVIFGTDKTTEGITLKNIQQIHITTPGWNFGKKNQAEGRGIRINSHEALLKELNKKDISIYVEIYLHCASPNDLLKSVNYFQYVRSEVKERNINLFQYQMLIGAIDCQLNYEQNFRSNAVDGSAECYFQKCEYECDGIKKIDLDEKDVKKGNFNTYFLDANKNIVKSISHLYSYTNIPRTFQEIKQTLGDSHYSDFQIYYTINTMIDTPIMIKLDNGEERFLLEQDGYIFTSPTREIVLWNNKKPFLESFSIKPKFSIQENTDSMVTKMFYQEQFLKDKMAIFQEFLKTNNVKQIVSFFQSFPPFIQNIIISKYPKLNILQNAEFNENTKKLKYKVGETTKEINFNNIVSKVENKQNDLEEIEMESEYGFYGIQSGKIFKIRDVSKPEMMGETKRKTKGRNIMSIPVYQLIFYISILFTKIDDAFKKLVPKTFSSRLVKFEELEKKDIEEIFKTYSEENTIFKEKLFPYENKKLVVFLKNLFSSKKPILATILKEKIESLNLVVQE